MRGIPGIDQTGADVKGLTFIVTGPTRYELYLPVPRAILFCSCLTQRCGMLCSGIGKETAAALLRRSAYGVTLANVNMLHWQQNMPDARVPALQ